MSKRGSCVLTFQLLTTPLRLSLKAKIAQAPRANKQLTKSQVVEYAGEIIPDKMGSGIPLVGTMFPS
jgi:hypothetical protein